MKVRKVKRKGPDDVWRDYWEADLRYKGRGSRKFFERKEEATEHLERLGRLHKTLRRLPTDRPTVGEFVTMLLEKRRGTCAEATFDVDHTQLGHFAAYEVRPGVPIRALRLDALDGDGDLILDVLKRQAKDYAVDSVRLLRNAIKQLLDRAVSQGHLLQHPLRDPETLKDIRGLFKTLRESRPEKVRAMSEEEARLFLKTAEGASRMFPLFAIGFGTGPRLEELIALQGHDDVWRAVNGGAPIRQMHFSRAIPQRMSRRDPHPKQLKTGADYHADIPADVGAILDVHKLTVPTAMFWLFQTKNGTAFSHEAVQREFKRVVKLAWPDDRTKWTFSPHSMRHTFATLHILAGAPAKWVSEQLGHKDITVTLKVYAKAFQMVRPGAADAHGVRLFSYRSADGTAMVQASHAPTLEPAPVLH